ncbi:hypothetical protein [Massilia suwonensis]|uniref:PcRGLX/YetA-like N-terminal RIFT barrel domain-containing protein n=1 Tax=Massilia suwonensis TaxID=648895 RepID=A0ABW0MI75_9BURK
MRIAAIAAFGTTLVACGGGGGGGSTSTASVTPATTTTSATSAASAASPPSTTTAQTTAPATQPPAAAPATTVTDNGMTAPVAAAPADTIVPPAAPTSTAATNTTATSTAATTTAYSVFGVVTDVRIQNTTAAAQTNLPVTFGQVFAAGDMQPADSLVGRFDNGTEIPLQLDVKATHPDGSVRHAVVSGIVPSMNASETRLLSLMKSNAPRSTGMGPKTLLMNGFSSSVHATIDGVRYNASADDIIKLGGAYQTWLSGAVANEWQVTAPLKTVDGVAHPHLTARFAIRWYDAIKKARVDVTLENAWAYEPNPQNLTYDAEVMVRGAVVYSKPGLTHYHHSRWRKTFWWGGDASQAHVKHNIAYLIASRAVPNYDQSVVVRESALAALKAKWTGTAIEPMNVGTANSYMPSTGGRDEIGLLPGWAATYLLSMDARAKEVTLGNGDLAGTWTIHYRDKNTDRPVSLIDFPYMTILGVATDTRNPATKLLEAFPKCAVGAVCGSSNVADTSHQPGFAYLPYLVTGDYYYLEELQFWAMYNVFMSNPGYRSNIQGLLWPDQVRGQAWSLRTLAEAAYITPDSDRLKPHFARVLTSNLDWYNKTYTNNASANIFGVLDMGSAVIYNTKRGIAPWQDDFFTAAVGHAAELGFDGAKTLLSWKAKAPLLRMTDPDLCWINASLYSLNIRDSATTPLYATMAQAVAATQPAELRGLACNSPAMAAYLKLKVGEMVGYSSGHSGYPSNMQPALAYSVDARLPNGAAAWSTFMSRSVKPDYGLSPQFAIVPR